MDEKCWDGFRNRLQRSARAAEVWEVVKSYRVCIPHEQGESMLVLVELRRHENSWALFSQPVYDIWGDDVACWPWDMLSTVASSPEEALRSVDWARLRR